MRTVAYGDTSLIVSVFTRSFGLQQYMVKGARSRSKKGGGQASYLQPAAILDLVAYKNENRSLQYIREMKWAQVYNRVLSSVTRTAIALFCVEMLQKLLKQPETQEELYDFVREQLVLLDECESAVAANLPLFFLLKVAAILGFNPAGGNAGAVFDLTEGAFVEYPAPGHETLSSELSAITWQLLSHQNAVTLYRIRLHHLQRRELLQAYLQFYRMHITDPGVLKSLEVLQTVLSA